MCKEYNGYTNYPTWAVSLWLDNTSGMYEIIKEIYLDMKHRSDHPELADWIKEYTEDNSPLIEESSLYSDLLNHSLQKVNWYEIEDNYIESFDENEQEEDEDD